MTNNEFKFIINKHRIYKKGDFRKKQSWSIKNNNSNTTQYQLYIPGYGSIKHLCVKSVNYNNQQKTFIDDEKKDLFIELNHNDSTLDHNNAS